MRKAAYSIVLLLSIAGAFVAGSWYNQRRAVTPTTPGAREIVQHAEPAHPAHNPDAPGMAPDSGMPSGPAHSHGGPADSGRSSASMSPGSVNISPEKQQLVGVRVSPVEKAPGTHTLRIFGRVAPDETRLYRLNAGLDGVIREVSPLTTGSQVKKDQWLATFAAPDSITAIQAYIVALNAVDRVKRGGDETAARNQVTSSNFQQRVEKLQNLGMSDLQIAEVEHAREVPQGIKILAPADGFVLARNVSPGLKFDRGAEWYRLADLSRVWILADAFLNEAQYLRPGVRAQVSLPEQRKTLPARVGEILPQFDGTTRTLKVRLEADNPGYILRPDMFVDVEVPIAFPPTIAIPVDAILDSGLKKTVFVDRGEGFFEPREVETGSRLGNRVEIVKGLTPGERIVVSGTFLVDSESRMKVAVGGISGTTGKDAVCDTAVDQDKAKAAGRVSEFRGKAYYFSSLECKQQFDKDPARYVVKAANTGDEHAAHGHAGGHHHQ